MRLPDLEDDLRYWFKFADIDQIDAEEHPALILARRVADLYDKCPACVGGGRSAISQSYTPGHPTTTEYGRCRRCGGTGVVPSDIAAEALTLTGRGDGGVWLSSTMRDLAGYLFGGDT